MGELSHKNNNNRFNILQDIDSKDIGYSFHTSYTQTTKDASHEGVNT